MPNFFLSREPKKEVPISLMGFDMLDFFVV